ncbi:MAG: exonuclease domain-containing protein [Crocinitomicaceae bacterium]|nr:exonuclease domain-containing protein [Crocinitomicaceae bacterium]
MNYIILDLEATCWRDRSIKNQSEIIEIGAVKINEQQEIIGEFNAFIKPKLHPQISEFCTELTTIEQSDIDSADDFKTVISNFQDWIDIDSDYLLCSWGFYDKSQFKKDCELNQLSTQWVRSHISLKHQYGEIKGLRRPMGMGGALRKERIELEGTHHRGIDDARNILKIFLKHFDRWKH